MGGPGYISIRGPGLAPGLELCYISIQGPGYGLALEPGLGPGLEIRHENTLAIWWSLGLFLE